MNDYSQPTNKSSSGDKFAMAALMMGLCSLFSISSVVIPLCLGSLAIIFAILSKGKNTKMSSHAKYGFALSLGSILLSLTLMVTSVSLFLFNEDWRRTINETYEETYGFTLDEYMDILFETDNNQPLPYEEEPQFEEGDD